MSKNKYEWKIVAVLGVLWGIVGLERLSITYLFPVILPHFKMTAAQAGMLVSTFSICFAAFQVMSGGLSDRIGRKKIIVPSVVFFSIFAAFTGFASRIYHLFVAWGATGFGVGGVFPPSAATIAEESTPERRGLNLGLHQALFPLIGIGLGAIIVTNLGSTFGWRATFFILGAIAFAWALVVLIVMKEPPSIMKMLERKKTGQVAEESGRTPVSAVFKYRNVVVSIFICCLYIAWMMVFASFCTMYLSRARGFDVATAGFILSAWGFGGFIGMIAIPALSDYFGRKPTMIVASIFAGLSVLVFVFSGFGPVGLFISLLVCGIFGWGAFPIFLSIFPSESVPPDVMATATSLPPSIGEVFGSIAMPTIAGLLADMYGLEYPMYLAGVAPILAAFVSLFYLETAPRIITKRSETTNKSM